MRSQVTIQTLLDAETVTQNTTEYSSSTRFSRCTGSAALFISSTAGSITVSQQCSNNNVDWYDPIDTSAAALAVVATDLTTTTGVYIAFTPALANYIRFKVVEGDVGEPVVTLKLLFRLEV